MERGNTRQGFSKIWIPLMILILAAAAGYYFISIRGEKKEDEKSITQYIPSLTYELIIKPDTVIDRYARYTINLTLKNNGDTLVTRVEGRFYIFYSDPIIEQYRQIMIGKIRKTEQNTLSMQELIPVEYAKSFYAGFKMKYNIPEREGEREVTDYRFYRYDAVSGTLVNHDDPGKKLQSITDRKP